MSQKTTQLVSCTDRIVRWTLANNCLAGSGKYGVVVAAADVKVTHAPCEGGVITGRPTRTFSPPTPLPMA